MIGLLVFRKYSSPTEYTWTACVTNGGPTLTFAGTTNTAQYANVQNFADAMQIGGSEVRLQASSIFNAPGGGQEAQSVIGDMIDQSGTLFLEAAQVWISTNGATMELTSNLIEAGEALDLLL